MTCDNDRCYEGNRLGFSWKGGRRRTWPPQQWSSDLKLLRECGVPSEARARPSDDGCVQPRRRPHTEVRRVSTAVTTLCRGARNTANHQTGRYPLYQWFNRESATCASRQRALRLLCRLFCCKRLVPSRTTTQCGTRHCTINAICHEGRKSGSWHVGSFLSDGWLEREGVGMTTLAFGVRATMASKT